jgi:hypothetical protein
MARIMFIDLIYVSVSPIILLVDLFQHFSKEQSRMAENLVSRESSRIPDVRVPRAPQRRLGDDHHRRHLREPERRRVLPAGRFHADVLVDAPAALQRARARRSGHMASTRSSAFRSTTRS